MNNEIPQKYLPLGTVCTLQGAQKSIMITGFCAVNSEEERVYDYLGVIYPQGTISSDLTLMFDHNQIEKINFMGFSNEEDKAFKSELAEFANIDGKSLYTKIINMLKQQESNGVQEQTNIPVMETNIEQITTPLVDTSSQMNNTDSNN